jgi:hypothetical protein
MMLGDLLARLDDEKVAAEAVLATGDLAVVAQLRALAEAEGQSLGAYAVSAVRRYTCSASDEEWISLMGAMGRTSNPGSVCMERAVAYVLVRARTPEESACECHGAGER